MAGTSIARVGAAAFVLGLAIGGPHPGVASADGPDSDTASASAGSADRTQSARGARPARGNRATTPDSSVPRGAAVDQRARATVSAPIVRDEDAAAVRPEPAAAFDAARSRPESPAGAATTAGSRSESAVPVEQPALAGIATDVRPSSPSPSAAAPAAGTVTVPTPPVAAGIVGGASAAPAGDSGCVTCWGAHAPTLGQAISTIVNHTFNATFDWLSATLPGGVFSDLVTGALVLVRRSLFFVPEGVTASQTTTGLTVSVNTGSTAYFRQDGTSVQVSGDPRFWGAQTFTLNTDQTVSVSNPGHAGCAGFVFTGGTAAGSLQTSQIDSIRFEGASSFAGMVDATVVGRPLMLHDAVRGLSGVTIDAAVVLDSDVEVDAGDGNATFSGTVDAAKKGRQALTVTALKTTTFAAPVGGITPLSRLTTQGVAPLTITQSSDTKTIPLRFLPEMSVSPPTDASPGVKYGIDVAIGDNPSQVYEFDTGGTGFFAGYNQPFWTNVPLTTTPASEVYNSGNYYQGVVSNTKVTLGQGNQTVSTAQPIGIGAVLAGGNSKNGATFDFTNPAAPPVEGRFFGDFGASFASRNGLTSPLVQLPGNLSTGFLVQLGPIGVTPQLTVGVTDDLRRQFRYAIPVILNPGGGTYPTSGYPVLDEFGFAPVYTVTLKGDTQPLGTVKPQNISCTEQCLATLIDSGAPTTGIRLPDGVPAPFNVGGQLESGTLFKAVFPTTAGRPPLVWEFTAGNNPSVDEVNYESPRNAGNQDVNVGLTLYNYYDVMFDVVNKTIYLRPTGGQASVVAGSVTTTGDQTYRQNATLDGTYTTGGGSFSVAGVTTLSGDTTVDAGKGDVTFSGTVDGDSSLTVNSSGATEFVRVVGSQTPLASLTTGGTTATAGVATSGSQSYGDDVSLGGLYTVTDGVFSVAGTSTLAGPVSVVGGSILFSGAIDSEQGKGYQLGLTPGDTKTANLNGAIGATNPLGGLQLDAAAGGTATVNIANSLALQGNLGYSSEKGLDIGDNVTANFADGAVIGNFTGAGVIVGAAGPLTINGFLISGNGKEGIQLQGASDVTITGSSIVGNGTDGINVDNSTRVTIGGNTITNNTNDGVMVKDSTLVSVAGNLISGNGSDGVNVSKGQNNSILSNTITANGANGVRLDVARNVTVVSNTVSANGTTAASKTATKNGGTFYASGVYVKGGQDVLIATNAITGNGAGALAADSASTKTYANGIYADGVTNLTASANGITGNGTGAKNVANLTIFADGVQLVNSTAVVLTGNTISGNGVLAGTETPVLTIHSAGVYSDNSSPVQITENLISANGSDGVEVKTGDSNAILSNSIFGNAGKGISLDGGNDGQPAPQVTSAVLGGDGKLVVAGSVSALIGYPGDFELQVFYSPSTDKDNVQGRQLVYSATGVAAGPFSYPITVPSSVAVGGFVTATVTPTSGAANTSKFSDVLTISGPASAV